MSRIWKDDEIAKAAEMWRQLRDMKHADRAVVVGKAIGRSDAGVLHRLKKCGPSFEGEAIGSGNVKSGRPPVDVIAERDRLLAQDTRPEHERLMGDPPPGRSALDRYTPPAPYRQRAWADAFGSKHSRLGGE